MSNIMIIASYCAPYGGNFISSVKMFADKMRELKHDVVFVFPQDTKNKEWVQRLEKEYAVIYIDNPHKTLQRKIIKQIKDIIKERKIEVVYSHFTGYDLDCFFACMGQAKLVVHMHNPINIMESNDWKQRVKSKVKWKLFNHRVQVIACASHLLEYIAGFGFDISESTYVLNGIDVDRVVNSKGINPFPYDTSEINILMHGWDPHRKGVDIAVKAINKVCENVHLYITFVDKMIMDNYLDSLHVNVEAEKITLLPAVENIMDYLDGADIFISPSRAEGSPYSLMEAIMAGKPSIGTNLPGLDWQNEIPALWTIDVDDDDALAKSIRAIIKMDKIELLDRISASKDIIVNKHSADAWASKITQYFVEKVV